MTAISATTARANLYHLIDQVNEDAEPVTITRQRGNAVLIGESDWRAIQETLFLESVPGFTESIRQARAAGAQEGSTELDWLATGASSTPSRHRRTPSSLPRAALRPALRRSSPLSRKIPSPHLLGSRSWSGTWLAATPEGSTFSIGWST